MSLLFKPNKKNRKKLHKFQVGGTIPVYASYQFKPAPVAKFDPSALLEKYATPKAAEETKSEAKMPEIEAPDAVGLPSDAAVTSQKANEIYGIIQEGLATVPGFEKSSYFTKLSQKYQQIVSLDNNRNQQEQELFEKNSDLMTEQGGQNSLYYKNGYYIAIDKEGNYKKVKAKELTDSKLKPLTFGELALLRKNDVNLAGTSYITADIADAMGYTYMKENYLDPAFEDIGSVEAGKDKKGGGYIENGKVIKDFIDNELTKSNEQAVKNAFVGFIKNLNPEVRNFLESKANLIPVDVLDENGEVVKDENDQPVKKLPTTSKEVTDNIVKILAQEQAKRLNISTKYADGTIYDLEKETNLAETGSITGSTTLELGDPMADGANPDSWQIGITESDNQLYDDRNMIARYLYTDASNTAMNLKEDLLLNEQSNTDNGQVFSASVKTNEAQLADGRLLSQIEGKDGNDNALSMLDVSLLDKSKGLKLVFMPVDSSGSVLTEKSLKDPEGYKKKAAELEKNYSGIELSKKLDELVAQHLPEGGSVKLMYQGTLIYSEQFFNEDPVKQSSQFTKTSSSGRINYVKALGDTGTTFWFNVAPEDDEIKSTVVLIPAANRYSRMLASTGVYIGKDRASINTTAESFGATKRQEQSGYAKTKAALTNTADLKDNIK